MMANETPLHMVSVLITDAMTRPQAPRAQQIITSQTSDNRVDQQH